MIDFRQMHTEIEIDSFRRYLEFMEQSLNENKIRVEEMFSTAEEDLSDEEYERFTDFYMDDAHDINKVHPKLLRKSIFLTIYSFLEYEMDSACKSIRDICDIKLKVGDLRYSGIRASKDFIVKACNLEFPINNEKWEKLVKYNKLRNSIAHSYGSFSDESFNAETELSGICGVEVVHNHVIYHKEFNYELLDIVSYTLTCLNKLIRELKIESWH